MIALGFFFLGESDPDEPDDEPAPAAILALGGPELPEPDQTTFALSAPVECSA